MKSKLIDDISFVINNYTDNKDEKKNSKFGISFKNGFPCGILDGEIIYINDNGDKKFKSDNKINHIPNYKKNRECHYICGPNNSGKSFYTGQYSKYYNAIYPNNDIILFSKKENDPALDFLNLKRWNLDNIEENNIKVKNLSNSLIIFDDIDTVRDPKIRNEIYKLIDDILCTGRSENIHCIVTNHLLSNYKETRIILNECDSITFFPQSGSSHQIKYTLKKYYGLSPKKIDEIMNLSSRWVTLFKNYPQFLLYENGVEIL